MNPQKIVKDSDLFFNTLEDDEDQFGPEQIGRETSPSECSSYNSSFSSCKSGASTQEFSPEHLENELKKIEETRPLPSAHRRS